MVADTGRHAMMACLPPGCVGAEVGVFKGVFSRRLYDIARPETLYLIDAWDRFPRSMYDDPTCDPDSQGDPVGWLNNTMHLMAPEIASGRVRIARSGSVPALATLRGQLDWVYIDANHRFGMVVADYEYASHALRGYGVLAGHDYIDCVGQGRGTMQGRMAIDAWLAANPLWERCAIVDTTYPHPPELPSVALIRRDAPADSVAGRFRAAVAERKPR